MNGVSLSYIRRTIMLSSLGRPTIFLCQSESWTQGRQIMGTKHDISYLSELLAACGFWTIQHHNDRHGRGTAVSKTVWLYIQHRTVLVFLILSITVKQTERSTQKDDKQINIFTKHRLWISDRFRDNWQRTKMFEQRGSPSLSGRGVSRLFGGTGRSCDC